MLNPLELHKYMRASASRGDLEVIYENVVAPRTNGKTVWLPRVSIFTTQDEAKQLKHYVNHEASHVRFSDFKELQESGLTVESSPLGAIWNLLEDHRVDYLNGVEYEGDREVGDFSYENNASKALKNISKMQAANPEAADLLLSMIAFDSNVKRDLYPNSHNVEQEAKSLLSDKGKEYYDKLMSGDYGNVLRNVRSTEDKMGSHDALELSKRIYKEVYGLDPDKEQERCQKEAKSKGNGSEGKGSADKSNTKETETKAGKGEEGNNPLGSAQDGEMANGDDKEHAPSLEHKIITVKYKDLLPQSHTIDRSGTVSYTGQHIDFSSYKGKGSDFKQIPFDKYKVTDYTKDNIDLKDEHWSHTAIRGLITKVGFDGFANKVRTRLQIRAKGRTIYGVKHGKLHKGALYRTVLKDARGFNERIFKEKITSDTLNSCVQIVVDASGSMSGEKIAHAAAAAALLSNTIGNILHIPVEVVAFSSSSVSTMFVIRSFNNPLLATETLIDRFVHTCHFMAGNSDGEAILWCYDRILRRKEKRKVMIVLSDGSPSDGRGGDIVEYTKKVVKGIEADHRVDIVGIGIMDDNVRLFYKEHQVLNRIDQLEPALLSLIDKKLK